jgi:predicted transcriptional regulator
MFGMSDKQVVIDVVKRLPESVSFEEIIEEVRIVAAVRRGRADIAVGRSKTHAEVEQLVESWATAWAAK